MEKIPNIISEASNSLQLQGTTVVNAEMTGDLVISMWLSLCGKAQGENFDSGLTWVGHHAFLRKSTLHADTSCLREISREGRITLSL